MKELTSNIGKSVQNSYKRYNRYYLKQTSQKFGTSSHREQENEWFSYVGTGKKTFENEMCPYCLISWLSQKLCLS